MICAHAGLNLAIDRNMVLKFETGRVFLLTVDHKRTRLPEKPRDPRILTATAFCRLPVQVRLRASERTTALSRIGLARRVGMVAQAGGVRRAQDRVPRLPAVPELCIPLCLPDTPTA